ncbi:MAG TPA: hypothetical protein VF212_08255 [Longimicrobiales bacterium]
MTEKFASFEPYGRRTEPVLPSEPAAGAAPAPGAGAMAYEAPRLERLGAWRALTLQQSVRITP